MTVVIPYRRYRSDLSLLYTLRGVELYLPQATNLFIVGTKPIGFDGYDFEPWEDDKKLKFRQRNIYRKLLIACASEKVTQNFIYMHDDIFLRRTHTEIPDYYSNVWGGNEAYKKTVANTNWPLNFDTHCPKEINKTRFNNTVARLDWKREHGYCIKTEYSKTQAPNTFLLYPDCKFRRPTTHIEIVKAISGRLYFSIDDKALNEDMILVLNSLYPTKSRWEL